MANRLKSGKSKTSDTDKLKPEKEEQVTVKQLVKDERTHKIAGTVALLVSLFLFIAFTSYYIYLAVRTRIKVFKGASILMPSAGVKHPTCWAISVPTYPISFFTMDSGWPLFLFCTLFFALMGANALFGKKIFSVWP